ncbi:MAG: PASTA domain-containing protein [Ruminococcaceae bacterium]|nr:PASTA domain-containing protein [Oscillospiraceae bacterium]
MILKTSPKVKTRIVILCLIVSALLVALLVRVAWIQFIRGEEYTKLAYEQQNSGRTIPATRGTIKDSEGNVLAISVSARQVSVNQTMIKTQGEKLGDVEAYQKKIADKLAEILELDSEEVLAKIQTTGRYREIARKVEVDVANKIEAWKDEEKIKGVYIDEDIKRYYPNNELAAHILGFTGRDDQGLVCGVEVALDSYLAGTPGRVIAAVDSLGNELPYAEETRVEPQNGNNVELNININIQAICEEVLQETAAKWNVTEGCAAIVMDPNEGKILAMASNPSFDLNNPYACPEGMDPTLWTGHTAENVEVLNSTVWRNKCLTDTYEPGSTFKAITGSIGVEYGIVNKDSMVDDGDLFLADWQIGCWKDGGHGIVTFASAVKNSCNGVFARLALDIGNDIFYKGLENFGFYQKTGVLLAGEANSIIHTNPTEIDRAVAGFGQRIQVTPMQMIRAYCAIANGGYLLTPQLVNEVTDQDGNVVIRYEKEVERQVISEATAKEMLAMLEGVVTTGTGHNAYVAGYRVAGKTGTSETIETDATDRFVASFCGIAPVDDPQIVVLVMIDHPDQRIATASGGRMAAPAAAEIIERSLEYLGVERRYTEEEKSNFLLQSQVPDLAGKNVAEAIWALESRGLQGKIIGEYSGEDAYKTKVVGQMPAPHIILNRNSEVVVYVGEEPETRPTVKVPDLVGCSLADAYVILGEKGLGMIAKQSGTVISQSIASGTDVELGTVITLELGSE